MHTTPPTARAALATLTLLLLLLSSIAPAAERPLTTVSTLDVERYLGQWHQIALLPNWFQRQCVADTSAQYALKPDGTIRVLNRCRREDGSYTQAEGVARRNKAHASPAILQVRFAPAFLSALPMVWGDYWVIALEEDYSVALVGAPNREYLWLLARTPTLDDATYARYVAIAQEQGFDVSALRRE
jgi:apolipoprotein D and lipocalin family protein